VTSNNRERDTPHAVLVASPSNRRSSVVFVPAIGIAPEDQGNEFGRALMAGVRDRDAPPNRVRARAVAAAMHSQERAGPGNLARRPGRMPNCQD
jgi:hypothetical protein